VALVQNVDQLEIYREMVRGNGEICSSRASRQGEPHSDVTGPRNVVINRSAARAVILQDNEAGPTAALQHPMPFCAVEQSFVMLRVYVNQ
jgi:hypothetical protein